MPAEPLTHPVYRADIDGLRAIAVLSVVGFHAFPTRVRGGFIGVDIFFVVSGFLISTILFGSLQRESFRFGEFYSRRIKRIFPALLLMLIGTYALGWFVLLADEFKQVGKHIGGGAGFVSNLLLWSESGYFDNAAETKPLLHLWSLGIEEQFYLAWPLLLWAAWKRKVSLLAVTIGIAAISLVLNVYQVATDRVAAYYLPQSRVWELLAGSILAYVMLRRRSVVAEAIAKPASKRRKPAAPLKPSRLSHLLSILGATFLGAGLLLITKETPFPGLWAVLPTVGSVLFIAAGPQAFLNRFVLSNPVLVGCGLISYPLYLWHWPLLSIARVVAGETPTRSVRIVAVALAFVLAWITYRLVEKPIRGSTHAKAAVAGLLVCLVLVGVAGGVTFWREGIPSRAAMNLVVRNDGDMDHLVFHEYAAKRFYPCTPESIRKDAERFGDALRCLQSKPQGAIDVAIIGDSHAEQLFVGLAEQLKEQNVSYYIKQSLPVLSDKSFHEIFRYVLSDANIKAVILTAVWYPKQGMVPQGSSLEKELSATVESLGRSGKTVYLTDDLPLFAFDPQQCKYSRAFRSKTNCVEDRAVFDAQHRPYYEVLRSVAAAHSNVKLVTTSDYVCDARSCSMARDGKLLYRDRDHLNLIGSRYVASRMIQDNPELAHLGRHLTAD